MASKGFNLGREAALKILGQEKDNVQEKEMNGDANGAQNGKDAKTGYVEVKNGGNVSAGISNKSGTERESTTIYSEGEERSVYAPPSAIGEGNAPKRKVDNFEAENDENDDADKKKKRINFVIEPGVWQKFSNIAFVQRETASELIRSFILDYIENNQESLEEYKRIMKKVK